MIRFFDSPACVDPARTLLAVGTNLLDSLAAIGQQHDCIGCSTAVAAPETTQAGTIEEVRSAFAPLAQADTVHRPESKATGLFRRRDHWTQVDIDARAQRLRTVRMPTGLVGAQRLLVINDLRGLDAARPVIAIGLWTLFAHPVVRVGARFGGTTDGLTAEIALSVHPDRYVLIDSDARQGLTYLLATPDIIVAELMLLSLRQQRAGLRGTGPWEDPLVQAATELNLGVRNAEQIDIDTLISPTLSSQQREAAASSIVQAAELIGVHPAI